MRVRGFFALTKKKTEYKVSADLDDIFFAEPTPKKVVTEGTPIVKALFTVTRYMQVTGLREWTISDYDRYVTHFAKITGVQTVEEINVDHIYS